MGKTADGSKGAGPRAASRPLNSALEVDLDFETAARPPPAPTEAATASLEDLIRARCAERRWDDPPRVAPPAPEVKRHELELDDAKSAKARAAALLPAYSEGDEGLNMPAHGPCEVQAVLRLPLALLCA